MRIAKSKEKQQAIKEVFNETYPINLLHTIAIEDFWDKPIIVIDEATQDNIDGLFHAMTMLPERIQEMLRLRFEDKLTYKEIGDKFSITAERVRYLINDGMVKLRRPPLRGYITYGKQGREAVKKQIEEERKLIALDPMRLSIRDMGLSVRATNRLIAKGCDVVNDVAVLTKEEIENISQLGKITRHEIAVKLDSMGIKDTAWSEI